MNSHGLPSVREKIVPRIGTVCPTCQPYFAASWRPTTHAVRVLVKASSEPGRGSVFTVSLPAAKMESGT